MARRVKLIKQSYNSLVILNNGSFLCQLVIGAAIPVAKQIMDQTILHNGITRLSARRLLKQTVSRFI